LPRPPLLQWPRNEERSSPFVLPSSFLGYYFFLSLCVFFSSAFSLAS
jgi:hypothetical protein